MKIIEQSFEIMESTPNLVELIEKAGRTCYKSEDAIGCTLPDELHVNKCPEDCAVRNGAGQIISFKCDSTCPKHSASKFVKMIIKSGHHSVLEHGSITARLVTNRGVTHELVRHRIASFSQESTRYVKYDGNMEFIRPVWTNPTLSGLMWVTPNVSEIIWVNAMRLAEKDYQSLLVNGWRPEQAREVLPNSLKTEIVITANVREWMHIFNLRKSKKSHPQMRDLMQIGLDQFKSRWPEIFD